MRDDGAQVAEWESERTILDLVEHAAAIQTRTKCRTLILSACITNSKFGYMAAPADIEKLRTKVEEAQGLARMFNASARYSRIGVYVVTAQLVADDVETVRSIASEVDALLRGLDAGLRACDPAVIRANANKLADVGKILSAGASKRVEVALEQARKSARKLAKAGVTAARVVDLAAIKSVTEARSQFLDLVDEGAIPEAPAAVEMDAGRAIDLDVQDDMPGIAAAPAAAPGSIEIDI